MINIGIMIKAIRFDYGRPTHDGVINRPVCFLIQTVLRLENV